jgi:hypothetical protein
MQDNRSAQPDGQPGFWDAPPADSAPGLQWIGPILDQLRNQAATEVERKRAQLREAHDPVERTMLQKHLAGAESARASIRREARAQPTARSQTPTAPAISTPRARSALGEGRPASRSSRSSRSSPSRDDPDPEPPRPSPAALAKAQRILDAEARRILREQRAAS